MRYPVLLLLCAAAFGQQDPVLAPELIRARFDRLKTTDAERATVLREMFAEAGCSGSRYQEDAVRGQPEPNLICTLPGTSQAEIVVTAHYDKTKAGEGAIDNWSGVSLLPSLYQSLKNSSHATGYVFVAFAAEEKGLVGSRDYVGQLSLNKPPYLLANVNIDSVGLPGHIYVWQGRADNALVNAAALVASRLKIPLSAMNLDHVGDGDSRPFRDRGVPVIDFHSLTRESFKLLHSKNDVRSAVDPQTHYDTYRLLTAYLEYLDSKESPLQ